MPVKARRTWNGGFVFGLLGVFAVSVSTANSIMDIINMEKVEKLLAERRDNGSRDDHRFLLQNSIDGEDTFFGGDDEDDEGQTEDDPLEAMDPAYGKPRSRGRGHRGGRPGHRGHRHNLTGVPDFSSVLADLTGARADRILKSDNPMPVTKKEYLRKDWCKTEPMVQKIREEGCLTRTLLNRFCYGQCNSFYIPKNPPRRRRSRKRPEEQEQEEMASFKSCGFCKPRRSTAVVVTLRCPSSVPQFKKKKVQRIKQCKCIAENVGP